MVLFSDDEENSDDNAMIDHGIDDHDEDTDTDIDSDSDDSLLAHEPDFSPATYVGLPLPRRQIDLHVILIDRASTVDAFHDFFKWLGSSSYAPARHDTRYKFHVSFVNEDAHGEGTIREFFRIMWDNHVLPLFFEDNGALSDNAGGLPLPSTRLDKQQNMETLGKFIALSLRHGYLPISIHPLCYMQNRYNIIEWRRLAILYDPVQSNSFPSTFEEFQKLSDCAKKYLDDRYQFCSDICDFAEVTSPKLFAIVREQFHKRIVYSFPVQRTLSALYSGINDVKSYEDILLPTRTMLNYTDKEMFTAFEKARSFTADDFLMKTSYDDSTLSEDKDAERQTLKFYTEVIRGMSPNELRRWSLFVNNTTVPQRMLVRIGTRFCFARTCFATFELGRNYDSAEALRDDMLMAMQNGFTAMTDTL